MILLLWDTIAGEPHHNIDACQWSHVPSQSAERGEPRRLSGSIQPKAPLDLASRRGDFSVVVQTFSQIAQASRKDFSVRRP
jgi:hypothetical protein